MDVHQFLSAYTEEVYSNALKVREILLDKLPDVKEQLDIPARMIAYCYGQRYDDMVCTIIPSKKGIKLGFYKGIDLPDPDKLLRGSGKLSRYVEINFSGDIPYKSIEALVKEAYNAYCTRSNINSERDL